MNPQNNQVIQTSWVRFRAAAYLGGRGLSYGCGNDPIVPKQALDGGKYSLNIDIIKHNNVNICDNEFSIFAPNSLDHVFIGPRPNPPVKELISKLKPGGHLVIHMIGGDPNLVREEISKIAYWQEKDTYIREDQYLGIFKLINRDKRGIVAPKPKPSKRVCIARYGAIGDMIMITPLIRKLYEDGYHVTLNITPYCAEVLKNNPYVGNVILQERDIIPNPDLGQYWAEWMNDYDKYINLSESIEGKLIKVEGRQDFYTTKEWRNKICDVNYYDQTMRLGGYPEATGLKGELYFSNHEERDAKLARKRLQDKFVIMWALKGSSYHKQLPLLPQYLSEWLDNHPKAVTFLIGSEQDKHLQFDHPQVFPAAGQSAIRDVFCFAKYVDLVVGPESAITNATACFDTPLVLFLSHSTHNQLCKYFTNHQCLTPDVECYPCNQLHYSLESCPLIGLKKDDKVVAQVPKCTVGISKEKIFSALDSVYDKWAESHLSAAA